MSAGINLLTTIVSGTARIPAAPSTQPQNIKDRKISSTERSSSLPIEPGLEDVLDHGVGHDETDHDDERSCRAQFEPSQKSGRDHRDEPEVRNEVEQEKQERPEAGPIHAQDEQKDDQQEHQNCVTEEGRNCAEEGGGITHQTWWTPSPRSLNHAATRLPRHSARGRIGGTPEGT